MLEGMACKRCVVCLNVHLEVVHQAVGAQEVCAGCNVKIILMLGRLLGLGLNVKVSGKAVCTTVVTCHGQELAHVIQLQSNIGVDQRIIAFSAAPEYVTGSTQLDGSIDACLDLACCDGVNVCIGAGGSAGHKHFVAKHVGSHPQRLDTGCILLFEQIIGHDLQVCNALCKRCTLGSNVNVMEAIVLNAQLLHQIKRKVHLCLMHLNAALAKGLVHGVAAKHIRARSIAGVPPAQCKAQMLCHGLAADHAVLVIITERVRIFAVSALKEDLSCYSVHKN